MIIATPGLDPGVYVFKRRNKTWMAEPPGLRRGAGQGDWRLGEG